MMIIPIMKIENHDFSAKKEAKYSVLGIFQRVFRSSTRLSRLFWLKNLEISAIFGGLSSQVLGHPLSYHWDPPHPPHHPLWNFPVIKNDKGASGHIKIIIREIHRSVFKNHRSSCHTDSTYLINHRAIIHLTGPKLGTTFWGGGETISLVRCSVLSLDTHFCRKES